jgi:hypothetical protein
LEGRPLCADDASTVTGLTLRLRTVGFFDGHAKRYRRAANRLLRNDHFVYCHPTARLSAPLIALLKTGGGWRSPVNSHCQSLFQVTTLPSPAGALLPMEGWQGLQDETEYTDGLFFVPVVHWPGMNQQAINEAVKNCVREALGQHEPLTALQSSLDGLKAAGCSYGDVDLVRNTCLRMLKVIYDADRSEEKDQAE